MLSEAKVGIKVFELGSLSPNELIKLGEKFERAESVPLQNVIVEESITDKSHIEALARSMSGPRKQLSDVLVRARIFQSEVVYDVIDGFHRVHALKHIKEPFVKSKVVYGCDDEELYDLRVLAANSVRSIHFARVAEWMQRSYSQTEWYSRGLSLVQICALVLNDSTGSRLGFRSNEIGEVREWLERKSLLWHKPVSAIYEIARVTEVGAPDLLKAVRIGGGGPHSKSGELNPARFKAIAFPLAGQYDLQRRVAASVLKFNLTAPETEFVATLISSIADSSEQVEKTLANPRLALRKMSQPTNEVGATKRRARGGNFHEEDGLDTGIVMSLANVNILPNMDDLNKELGIARLSDHVRPTLQGLMATMMREYSLGMQPSYHRVVDFALEVLNSTTNKNERQLILDKFIRIKPEDQILPLCILISKLERLTASQREKILSFVGEAIDYIEQDNMGDLMGFISSYLGEFSNDQYSRELRSSVVDEVLELIKNKTLLFKKDDREWKKLLKSLEMVAGSCDQYTRKSVLAWIKSRS